MNDFDHNCPVTNKPAYACLPPDENIDDNVLSLVIDKLTLTAHVTDAEQREEIKKSFYDTSKKSPEFQPAYSRDRRYRLNVAAPLGPDTRLLAQAYPYNDTIPFVRIDWSPAKAGPDSMPVTAARLAFLFPDGYGTFRLFGTVTRIDLAVDVRGVNVNDLEIWPKRTRRTALFVDSRGRVETRYFGSSKSDAQWRIYDKRRERAAKGAPAYDYELTRIERVLRPRLPFKDLLGLKNPYRDIAVFDLSKVKPPVPLHYWHCFNDSCRLRGPRRALNLVPKSKRPMFKHTLIAAIPNWWRPDELWEAWPHALAGLGVHEQPSTSS